ncbi:MAG: hypothetical protein ACPG49_11585, partial [Chitinophagales bacterium]
IEVNSPKTEKAFLDLPNLVYKDIPNYIRPLNPDIKAVFDTQKNKKFESGGEVIRWILQRDNGETIGRVAAFIDPKAGIGSDIPVGGTGFFECINDQMAANKLFDACKKWIEAKGKEGMDGPINFGERDRFWGLLIENFSPTSYLQNYNPPYYQQLFENYGFQIYFKQITFYRKLGISLSEKEIRWANMVLENDEYSFGYADKNNLDKHAKDFATVYNQAWGGSYEEFEPLSDEAAKNIMDSLKPILDEKIVYFGYHKDEPIAVFINLPEINSILKSFNGKFGWWQKLQFMWRLKVKKDCKRMYGMSFGVVPKYQRRGAVAALIKVASDTVQDGEHKDAYRDMEFTWIADYNVKMINMCKNIGGEPYRKHATYRKLFDENAKFERYPII